MRNTNFEWVFSMTGGISVSADIGDFAGREHISGGTGRYKKVGTCWKKFHPIFLREILESELNFSGHTVSCGCCQQSKGFLVSNFHKELPCGFLEKFDEPKQQKSLLISY